MIKGLSLSFFLSFRSLCCLPVSQSMPTKSDYHSYTRLSLSFSFSLFLLLSLLSFPPSRLLLAVSHFIFTQSDHHSHVSLSLSTSDFVFHSSSLHTFSRTRCLSPQQPFVAFFLRWENDRIGKFSRLRAAKSQFSPHFLSLFTVRKVRHGADKLRPFPHPPHVVREREAEK